MEAAKAQPEAVPAQYSCPDHNNHFTTQQHHVRAFTQCITGTWLPLLLLPTTMMSGAGGTDSCGADGLAADGSGSMSEAGMAELHVQASDCSEAIYNPSCSHSSTPTSSVEMSFNFLITAGPALPAN